MLIFYADSSLPEGKGEEVKLHLAECRQCSNFHDFLKETLAHIEAEKNYRSDPFLFARIMAAVGREKASSVPLFSRLLPRLAAAAVIAVAVAGGTGLGKLYSGRPDLNLLMSGETELIDEIRQEPLESFLLTLNE